MPRTMTTRPLRKLVSLGAFPSRPNPPPKNNNARRDHGRMVTACTLNQLYRRPGSIPRSLLAQVLRSLHTERLKLFLAAVLSMFRDRAVLLGRAKLLLRSRIWISPRSEFNEGSCSSFFVCCTVVCLILNELYCLLYCSLNQPYILR